MTSAYILIAAILLLGGLIAALGDRLGTKVGKARLRLFGLRPRQTAIVVTIVTGTLIAASTLAILFALSKSLRQGIFELDDILQKRREIRNELTQVTKSKERVEGELKQATNEQAKVEQRLAETNQNYQLARGQMQAISKQSNTLRVEVKKLLGERQQLKKEQEQLAGKIRTLKQQTSELNSQLNNLEEEVQERDRELTERDSIIALREEKINQQNQTITEREQNIASLGKILVDQENRLAALEEQQELLQVEISVRDEKIVALDEALTSLDTQLQDREAYLADLENQLVFLKRGVADLELSYQKLRQGNLALSRGEVLTFSLVRIDEQEKITQTIDRLLREANRIAILKTDRNSSSKERVVQITKAEVNQLIQQIKDGAEYVVRILSAGNYVQGEKLVRVFADVTENMLIFHSEEVIASVSIAPNSMTSEEMQERLNLLLSITEFRARSAGMIGKIKLGESYFSTLSSFFQALKDSGSELDEIQAVVMETAYTAGPLQLNLVAIKDGAIVFSTAATATQ